MSYSFILIDLNNSLDIKDINSNLSKKYNDYEILYCSSKKCEMDNVISLVFDKDEDVESIINYAVAKITKNNLVVIREFTSCEEIYKQTKSLLLNNQIVYFKKELSPIKKFFWNILYKIIKLLFSKDITLTNFNCVTYGEIATNILYKLEYPSNLMRVNQWQGIQLVDVEGGKKYKFKYNKLKSMPSTFIPLFISILLITLFFIFKSKLNFLIQTIFWLTAIICLVISGIYGINWFIKTQIGENNFKKVKIKGE